MARNTRIYGPEAVEKYITEQGLWDSLEIITGCLLDTYIIYHGNNVIEVLEEKYLNEWSSAYIRHIYRKGLPARFEQALREQDLEI